METLYIREVGDLCVRQTLRPPVRPAGAQPSLPESSYIGLCVRAALRVMAEIMDRSDPGVQSLGCA